MMLYIVSEKKEVVQDLHGYPYFQEDIWYSKLKDVSLRSFKELK